MKIRQLMPVPLFVGLLGLGACSSEEAIPTDIKVDPIEWSTCDEYPDDEMIECGVLEVPLDYSDLEGETIEISLIRIPATSSKPKGVVLSNPGGPGESGVDFVSSWSVEFVENLGLEDFDIVGFDPRGVGRSGGLSCLTDQQNDKFVYLDYTPDDDREQELYDEWMEIDEPCTEKFGKALRFYSTENTARDMDLIRESMGFEQINYLGISYGTYLGGVYATLFPDHVESMFLDSAYDPQGDTAEQTYGKLDILFNNAGISHSQDDDAVTTEEDVWDLTFDVNVKGVFLGCKYGIPALRRSGGGTIINTASFVAILGAATPQLAYTSSKGAVLSMSKELAAIHARENIRVNALCPGPLRTELLMKYLDTEEKRQRRLVHVPMGRFGEAKEIANAVLFLASDEASFVTGATFLVDGGITCAYTTPLGEPK